MCMDQTPAIFGYRLEPDPGEQSCKLIEAATKVK
jgi:hypothetical protein